MTTSTTILLTVIFAAVVAILVYIIRQQNQAITSHRNKATEYLKIYSECLATVQAIQSAFGGKRVYSIRECTPTTYDVIMNVTPLSELSLPRPKSYNIAIKLFNSDDPAFARLLAEELRDKLTE